jgi:hypothetical protein
MMWPHERPEAHFTSHRLLLDTKKEEKKNELVGFTNRSYLEVRG